MSYQITFEYRGASLSLSFEDSPAAVLSINGMKRDQARIDASTGALRLGSSVQTDYEWHEYVEGIVEYREDRVIARLIASNVELIAEEIERNLA